MSGGVGPPEPEPDDELVLEGVFASSGVGIADDDDDELKLVVPVALVVVLSGEVVHDAGAGPGWPPMAARHMPAGQIWRSFPKAA